MNESATNKGKTKREQIMNVTFWPRSLFLCNSDIYVTTVTKMQLWQKCNMLQISHCDKNTTPVAKMSLFLKCHSVPKLSHTKI